MEIRKQKEAEFHDAVRNKKREDSQESGFISNRIIYDITRKNQQFIKNFFIQNCSGKKVLDYCCGDGDTAVLMAEQGATVSGIDISYVSIQNAKERALKKGLKSVHFMVMDAERLRFKDKYFDVITCLGVLHHLDIKKAYPELARVLKLDGKIICNEPLMYNPVFQLYRRLTPHLRTKWETEHILSRQDIRLAEKYFGKVETQFFHLATLFAVPFRYLPGFYFLLGILEKIDSLILRLPLVKWLSWQIVFILSEPKKNGKATF